MNEKKMIQGVQVSFWTPLLISVTCAFLDVIRRIVINAEFKSLNDLRDFLVMLISCFFPTFIAAAITALIAYYGNEDGCSGIREDRGRHLLFLTYAYGMLYIAYIFLSDRLLVVVAYTVLSGVYAWIVMSKCVDRRFSLWRKMPKVKDVTVKNTPN